MTTLEVDFMHKLARERRLSRPDHRPRHRSTALRVGQAVWPKFLVDVWVTDQPEGSFF